MSHPDKGMKHSGSAEDLPYNIGGSVQGTARRPKVLASAYACEPNHGSEPGIGWNWVREISKSCDIWVITRANNRPLIEDALATEPLHNAHFVYFDLPRWIGFWKKGQRGIRLYYYLWQVGAYFAARRLHRQIGFELLHHVTFGKYCVPSFLVLLPAPLVWGPVGGGESTPRSLWFSLSLRGKVYELLRHLARRLGELDPFVRLTARRAAFGIATTTQTERRLRTLGCKRILVMSHAALCAEEIRQLDSIPPRHCGPFRVASIGNLLHLKGFDLGLRAFALFHRQFPTSEYWLIGEGPEKRRLQNLAQELQVAENVKFWGVVPRSQVLEKLAECDVLLHPALHDSSGWVSVEAMATGRPVVCLELGGTALQVTEETGIKVPVISTEQVVCDLAAGMRQLACDASYRARLGQAARGRVAEHFNWEKKGQDLSHIYDELLSSSGTLSRVITLEGHAETN
jgi:glycosyltransferase involved in cell wall biosynthesis